MNAETYGELLPRGPRAGAVQWREIRSAMGWEGTRALLTYLSCILVLASGLWVSLQTWADTTRGLATVPLARELGLAEEAPKLSLSPFWMVFMAALGVGGWLLSGQVTKRWLRVYVVSGLLISLLLLITIGRNANFEQAAADARADARRLLQADSSTEPSLTGALLARLCIEGNLGAEQCLNAAGIPAGGLDVVDSSAVSLDRCLPGWTLSAFDQWLTAASFDRQIAALTALASCEIGAVDPAAESAEGEPIEVVVAQEPTAIDAPAGDAASEEGPGPVPTVPGSAALTEALRVQRSEVLAHEAIVRGADEILSFSSGPSHFAEFRFSGLAWLVLLAAALLWYRQLEIRAGAHRLGPIDVQFEPVGEAKDDGASEDGFRRRPATPAEAIFKEAVIQNVPEPGAVPGSGALAPVGDLVAQSDLPQKTVASGVIEVLQTIFATKGGFTVTCSVRSSGETHSVFVRLRDTRTGDHLASHIAESRSPEAASRLAGYWIAGWIIHRSAYVPSWAQWSEDDAATFVRTGWEQGKEFSLSLAGSFDTDLDDLGTVNSLILAQRAYAHQLSLSDGSNHFAALEDFARAVHRRPRYPVARYRRGAVLGTMMLLGGSVTAATGRTGDRQVAEQRPVTPSRLQYLFGDLILGDHDKRGDDRKLDEMLSREPDDGRSFLHEGGTFSPTMRWEMLMQVGRWASENRAALKWRRLARLRPGERFFWRSFARGDLGKDWARVLDLERCTCAERLEVVNAESGQQLCSPDAGRTAHAAERLHRVRRRIERRARQPDSHWQLSYNLGCFYAIRSKRLVGDARDRCEAEAMEWLERSLDRPAVSQLVREWVLADGDLNSLRHRPDFTRWTQRVARLAREPDEGRVDSGAGQGGLIIVV